MNDQLVIVSCADSGELHTLRLASDGSLSPQQVLPLGGQLMPMAFSPDRRRLYVARRSEPLAVLTLAVDAGNGRLELLAETPLPASMAYVCTDRSGRFLFSASYGGNQIAVQRIDDEGVVLPEATVIPTAPNAHAIAPSPDNRQVLATALGGGHLMRFGFDAANGTLIPQDPPLVPVHEGAGPRHFVFNRDGDRVYLLNELDATLVVFERDLESGALAALQTLGTVPAGFDGEPWAADLHLSPCGRWLYSCERRTSTIAGFAVEADGRLRPIGHWPTQPQPRGFRIGPDGRHLVSSGQLSSELDVFAIDADSGALSLLGHGPVGANPNWIEMLELPAA
ncbi:lactonase family protein [Caldimonas tepidiphila]|uniref:lactonase family protein n=1 Tax=Caldimonas tepidiphila TaxID=2315841 RepID=UPI000E5B15A8|nr:beta-propeller fold lactonase family protein [Caldimonas tepidiphila]